MKNNSPRLIDIAENAGLSVTTVSRILSGQRLGEYNTKTQERVRKIATELGWRPNLVVQGMKTGKTQTIGVFMAPFDTHWTGVLYGVHDALLDAKQVPLVLWPHALVHPTLNPEAVEAWAVGRGTPVNPASPTTPPPPDSPGLTGDPGGNDVDPDASDRRELERIHCLEDRRVDAIISWPLHEKNARQRLAMLSARGWRVVLLDDDLPEPAKPTRVGSDEAQAMRQAVEHLRELGHQRLAYVGLARHQGWVERRYQMFRAATQDDPQTPCLELAGPSYHQHRDVAPFLQAHPQITAVVAASDHVARQVILAARSIDRPVPQRLSVVGFGNDVFGQGDLPLTTIDQQPYDLGRLAAEIALQPKKNSRQVKQVPTRLIVRQSTAPPTACS